MPPDCTCRRLPRRQTNQADGTALRTEFALASVALIKNGPIYNLLEAQLIRAPSVKRHALCSSMHHARVILRPRQYDVTVTSV